MIKIFKIQTEIHVDKSNTWNVVSNSFFVRDFLPEIYKNVVALNFPCLTVQKNGLDILPAYVIRNNRIHWKRNEGTGIKLTKSSLNVTINHIEINLETQRGHTLVSLEVEYNNPFGLNFMLANKVIKSLFSHKLFVLKQDLETKKQSRTNLESNFGYPVF